MDTEFWASQGIYLQMGTKTWPQKPAPGIQVLVYLGESTKKPLSIIFLISKWDQQRKEPWQSLCRWYHWWVKVEFWWVDLSSATCRTSAPQAQFPRRAMVAVAPHLLVLRYIYIFVCFFLFQPIGWIRIYSVTAQASSASSASWVWNFFQGVLEWLRLHTETPIGHQRTCLQHQYSGVLQLWSQYDCRQHFMGEPPGLFQKLGFSNILVHLYFSWSCVSEKATLISYLYQIWRKKQTIW